MAKDYARQTNARPKKSKQKKQRISKKTLGVITVIAIFIFVIGLFFLKLYGGYHAASPLTKPVVQKLPPPATEELKFDFYTILPKLKVNPK